MSTSLLPLLLLPLTTGGATVVAATTMLLFCIDSHVGSGGEVHGVASLETKHTVLVKATPVSSNVPVTALLLFHIDSHVVPGDEVHGMAALAAKHTVLVKAKPMSSLEMKYMMKGSTHPSSSYLQLRAFEVRGLIWS